mgnify:CR=1 FL=1
MTNHYNTTEKSNNKSFFAYNFKPAKIWLTSTQLNNLPTYNTGYPTGQVVGKQWKRRVMNKPNKFIVCEYGNHPDKTKIGIKTYDVILVV